jgi:hypothetical protein
MIVLTYVLREMSDDKKQRLNCVGLVQGNWCHSQLNLVKFLAGVKILLIA